MNDSDFAARIAAAAGSRGVLRKLPRNAVVLDEGDRSDTLYVVRAGRVKIYVANENGRELVLGSVGPGEYFGELVLDGRPRSAAAITIEPTTLLAIPSADVKRLLATEPELALAIILDLIGRVRELTEKVKAMALQDVYGRLARLLSELSVEQGGRLRIAERLTHQAIAERIGASREMVSKLLRDLAEGGYLSIANNRITLNGELPLKW